MFQPPPQILTPFLLRRLKTDVEYSLPPKKEILVYAPLTQHQVHVVYVLYCERKNLSEWTKNRQKWTEIKDRRVIIINTGKY